MKVLYIHNKYGKPSGEEHASGELASLLEDHGHEVRWFTRSSEEIVDNRWNLFKSFFTGVYNPYEAKRLAKVLDEFQPDVVQVQNLYPFISPSIFKEMKRRKIPTVMRCPNYRLFCPYGLALTPKGELCEKCFNCSSFNCVVKNCAMGLFKSLGYSLRNGIARHFRWILDGVDVFIVQSEFQKNKFIENGIPAEKLAIVPGICPEVPYYEESENIGDWVGFVGRFSAEKGADEFIEAARLLPDIPFKVAGSINEKYIMPNNLPPNLEFVGFLKGEDFDRFYLKCRMAVVPSKWYEGFPNVILRAFLLNRPVVTTSIGAMDSIVDNKQDGVKVPPANGQALAFAIQNLYENPDKCLIMGKAGRDKALSCYSRIKIYEDLFNAYMKAGIKPC